MTTPALPTPNPELFHSLIGIGWPPRVAAKRARLDEQQVADAMRSLVVVR